MKVWLHTLASSLLMVMPWVLAPQLGNPYAFIAAFFFSTLGAAQNIGIVHEFAHRTPRGPRALSRAWAAFAHALGGLVFEKARTAHRYHHAFLGGPTDPDRHGYDQTTEGRWRRFRYLLLVGPLRGWFAPVELASVLAKLPQSAKDDYARKAWKDRVLLLLAQLVLIGGLGWFYLGYAASLIFANMLSNVREMTEHGNGGQAAYVNIKPSLFGVLFFSTPGFWYHGAHHLRPEIPYWELPSKAADILSKDDIPLLNRTSYLKYLWSGV
mgnify:CR=1 FL=1